MTRLPLQAQTALLALGLKPGERMEVRRKVRPELPAEAVRVDELTPLPWVCWENTRESAAEHDELGPKLKMWTYKAPFKVGETYAVTEAWTKVPRTAYWHDQSIPHYEFEDDGFWWWVVYRAGWDRTEPRPWKSAAVMPAQYSRTHLICVSVKVERGELWEWVGEFERREL